MKSSVRIVTLGLLASLAGTSALHAAVITYTDSVFANADWEWQVIAQSAGTSGTVDGQVLAGGNPGAYRQHRMIWDASTGPFTSREMVFANLLTAFSYDPVEFGAIESLAIGYDVGGISSSLAIGYTGDFRPYLRQNDILYSLFGVEDRSSTVNGCTSVLNLSALASDWVSIDGAGLNPDFSVTGAAIEFGYRVRGGPLACNGANGCTSAQLISGIDNFSISITSRDLPPVTSVPEPGSVLMLAGGLLGLLVARRTRQRAA